MASNKGKNCAPPEASGLDKNCPPPESSGLHKDGQPPRKGVQVGEFFDALEHLFHSKRDFLIQKRYDKQEKLSRHGLERMLKRYSYMIILSICIPANAEEDEETGFLRLDLNGIFSELAEVKNDFVVVLVVRMTPDSLNHDKNQMQVAEAAFTRFFSAFSEVFLAVPVSDFARSLKLFKLSGSPSYYSPGCIIVDTAKKQVLNRDFPFIHRYGVNLYPFTPERLLELHTLNDKMLCGEVPLESFLHCQSSDVLDCFLHGKASCGGKKTLSSIANKVVYLYYLCDGMFIEELRELYNKCRAKELDIEIVVIRAKANHVTESTMAPFLERDIDSMLVELKMLNIWCYCCGWLFLPYSDRISRKMFRMCLSARDKLVVVGPNNSYVDLDGKEVFLEFGIEAYPFTKQAAWDSQVNRLRGLSLQEWLGGCGVELLLRTPDGGVSTERLSVSQLPEFDYLVWFGSTFDGVVYDWDSRLPKWVDEMKTDSKRDLKVIVIILGDVAKDDCGSIFTDYCAKAGWFIPYPYTNRCSNELFKSLMGGLPICGQHYLAAFGPNGKLLRLGMERSLMLSTKAVFPEADDLREDVRFALKSQLMNDVWSPDICSLAFKG